ncbi:MAG: SusD/RagB family nutrient-binding outer membrane lipoprotein, partial [Chitinophagaceae bacterium]|nr:SusD/RagB family nutrient-binding outer membrane lipoprotein [Chitinophagaceae bacterium]
MRKIYIIVILLTSTVVLSNCKKFLDVNTDPNHPLSVSESLVLPPVEVTLSTGIIGGLNGTTCAYWMQHISQNQLAPNMETYRIQPTDVDGIWSYSLYPNMMENLYNMINQAEAANHFQYAAIGKTLMAYSLSIATDFWGDVPYSQGLDILSNLKPAYDSQESIYGSMQNLLDSAIYYAKQTPSKIAPGSDDFIYGGDMGQWTKLMYFLKARYYLRLSNAPGRTASVQADSALTALANAFTSNDDNCFVPYTGAAGGQSPWYQNTLPGAGGVVLAASFIDSLVARKDPRLQILADTSDLGTYSGRPSGAEPNPDPNAYSSINTFYGGYLPEDPNNSLGAAANLYLAAYTEQLFIQAEATFYKSGVAAAVPIYKSAIQAHMNMLGISSSAQTVYINSRPPLTAANAVQQIISEKYIAGFLGIEPYNDWRRTGYPVLTLAQNAFVP